MLTLSIDAKLLDKTKFKHIVRKNGQKAVFIDLVLIESPNSEYGDYMVKQSLTKEERAAGKQMPILGNAKIFKSRKQDAKQQQEAPGDDQPPF